MLDTLTLTLKAGDGGKGSTALWHGRRTFGGDGGKGGDLYLQGSTNVSGFAYLSHQHKYEAENGMDGLDKNKFGANGKDLVIQVPLTTEVVIDGDVRFTIEKNGQTEKILTGGQGTYGNLSLKKHPFRRKITEEDRFGEEATVTLVLKLTADIIFMGYPNAGKSSLLNMLTNAKAKTAPYEFTTLEPQTGHMDDLKLMDLPGLIDGTHAGKGLGTDFVQHTQRTKMVAHLVSLEASDPITRYKTLRDEIKLISEDLYNKKEVVILTKTDEITPEAVTKALKQFQKIKKEVIACSILDEDSIQQVRKFLKEQLPPTIS